ncbi:hypothetical protein RR46_00755 [Papilio xuthus]|uniref:Uncharacterized protein n=1 Tax=Papilio xuthus TaxID=66420 RepID=A0A0N0PAI8_PAPXU|nr:hypothetical protein RR46_00755 [Papilio xuthus]
MSTFLSDLSLALYKSNNFFVDNVINTSSRNRGLILWVQLIASSPSIDKPGQSEHGHAGGAGYGKPAGVQPRAPPAPYAQPYQPPLRLHNPGYGSAALSYRPGQSEHGHAGGAGYGKPAGVQPRAPPAPYAQPYQPPLRLHNPGYGSAALSYR